MPARDPRTWKLEGSTDGETWTLLDERKDEPLFAKRHETRGYQIAKPTACRFFRFTFMPNPGVTHFQVSEIQLDGVAAPKHSHRLRRTSIRGRSIFVQPWRRSSTRKTEYDSRASISCPRRMKCSSRV